MSIEFNTKEEELEEQSRYKTFCDYYTIILILLRDKNINSLTNQIDVLRKEFINILNSIIKKTEPNTEKIRNLIGFDITRGNNVYLKKDDVSEAKKSKFFSNHLEEYFQIIIKYILPISLVHTIELDISQFQILYELGINGSLPEDKFSRLPDLSVFGIKDEREQIKFWLVVNQWNGFFPFITKLSKE